MATITPTAVELLEVVIEGGHLVGYVRLEFSVAITLVGTPPYPITDTNTARHLPSGAAPHIVSPPGTLTNFATLRYMPWITNPGDLVLTVPPGDTHITGPGGDLVTGGDYPVAPPVPPSTLAEEIERHFPPEPRLLG